MAGTSTRLCHRHSFEDGAAPYEVRARGLIGAMPQGIPGAPGEVPEVEQGLKRYGA